MAIRAYDSAMNIDAELNTATYDEPSLVSYASVIWVR